MSDPLDPYEAALLPEQAQRLWVLGLSAVPVPPVTLSGVQAAAAACAPGQLAYDAPPVEVVPGSLVRLSGTFQLVYPKDVRGVVNVVAVAVVVDSPPSALVGWGELDAAQDLRGAGDVLLGEVGLTVGRVPGA